jgi:hypothetical protein
MMDSYKEREWKNACWRSRGPEILGPVILALQFLLLTWWSWRKWPDILVDFGRELYVPWQLASGKILFKDIDHLFGPFSQYFNAALFKVLGVSLSTLIWANLAWTAIFTVAIYLFVRRAADAVSATAAGSVFLAVFAFSEYLRVGNFNFITPYSHESTHGIILAVLMIFWLGSFIRRKRWSRLAAAGLAFGMVLLTKAEISAAAAAAALVFFALLTIADEEEVSLKLGRLGVFILAALLPLAAAGGYFLTQMQLPEALRAMGGAWTKLLSGGVWAEPITMTQMGMDDLAGNLVKMLRETLLAVMYIGAGMGACLNFGNRIGPSASRWISAVILLLGGIFSLSFKWVELGRALPVITLVITAALSASFFRGLRRSRAISLDLVPVIVWSVFSFCLLFRIIFHAKICFYGFYLALPAVMLLVVYTTWHLPRWLDSRNCYGSHFRLFMIVVILIGLCSYFKYANGFYQKKDFPVGIGGDKIVTFGPRFAPEGWGITVLLKEIRENMPEDASFIVLPEGVMLNYLARRESPSRYVNFVPFEVSTYGEENILNDFRENPPDYFILVHREMQEFKVGYFGRVSGYGLKIAKWVYGSYAPVRLIGFEPFVDGRFGIKILKRKPE